MVGQTYPLAKLTMSQVSIIIQYPEDWPGNPGWWRFSRPRHEMRDQAPEISENYRWHYGSEAEASEEAADWDRTHHF